VLKFLFFWAQMTSNFIEKKNKTQRQPQAAWWEGVKISSIEHKLIVSKLLQQSILNTSVLENIEQ